MPITMQCGGKPKNSPTLTANNSGLKPSKLKNYHVFRKRRTSAFSWYPPFRSYIWNSPLNQPSKLQKKWQPQGKKIPPPQIHPYTRAFLPFYVQSHSSLYILKHFCPHIQSHSILYIWKHFCPYIQNHSSLHIREHFCPFIYKVIQACIYESIEACHNCPNGDTIWLKIVQILPLIFLTVPKIAPKMPQIALIVPPTVPNVPK